MIVENPRTLLVTGFGPFPGVDDNPSGRAALAVSGARVAGSTVVGLVLPVSFERGPIEAIEWARRHRPRVVVGLGVAMSRAGVTVERRARRPRVGAVDVDGVASGDADGPEEIAATVDVVALADALGASVSDDAGSYVCNAWLYQVCSALPGTPVGFVHVPPSGIEPARLLEGLAAIVGRPRSVR